MKISFLLLIFFTACQDYNANTFDKDRYAVTELTGSTQFKASYRVIQNRCMNCHDHAEWSSYTDEQDWVNNNLVAFGDIAGSDLITRIKNYGGTDSNMPQGGSPLPTEEFETLRTWVQP